MVSFAFRNNENVCDYQREFSTGRATSQSTRKNSCATNNFHFLKEAGKKNPACGSVPPQAGFIFFNLLTITSL
jgi:hypothetical protein